MVLGGALGGNMLGIVTGGLQPAGIVYASTGTYASPLAVVSKMHFNLDPSNPTLLRDVEFMATMADGSVPSHVEVRIQAQGSSEHQCHAADSATVWRCPLQGVSARDAARVQVLAQ